MMILTTQKAAAAVGRDREEIKAGVMGMKKIMTMALTQEEVLGATQETVVVAEWEMKVQTGEPEATREGIAIQDQGTHLIMAMKTETAAPQAGWEAKVQTGALAVIRAANAEVIQMIKIIWEEVGVSHAVLKTKEEEETKTVPGQEGVLLQDHLQPDVAVAAGIGKTWLSRFFVIQRNLQHKKPGSCRTGFSFSN